MIDQAFAALGVSFSMNLGIHPDVNSRLPVNRDFFGADALEKRK
jgi:hypothetical protein